MILTTGDNQELSLGGPWVGHWLLITPNGCRSPDVTGRSLVPLRSCILSMFCP